VRSAGAALEKRGVPAPELLLWCATGTGELAEQLRGLVEVPLAEVEGVPAPWDEAVLAAGRLGRLRAWLLDDLSGAPGAEASPSWAGGFPAWLAASAGATLLLHTSAGSALTRASANATVGGIAVLRDHLQFGDSSPLAGLGESELGPLFPDLSQLHHLGLRRAALDRAERLGLEAAEAVAACTRGPALETPAERRMLRLLGADVAVPSLATPLLAAGHAGLAVLSLVAVTDADERVEVTTVLEAAATLQPALEELVLALVEDLRRAAASRREAEA